MVVENKTLTCADCGTAFDFTSGEQEFFKSKGFTNEPKRCPSCRQINKARRSESGASSYQSRS